MKKLFLLLFILSPFYSSAQWLDVSAVGGAAPYKISAGLKNSTTGIVNVSVAFVKLKFIDIGVQYSFLPKVTLCSVSSPGVFADMVVMQDDEKQNIVSLGVDLNYTSFGKVSVPGAYFKDGSKDSLATTIDKTNSYGVRIGYKRMLTEHIYIYGLLSPTYSTSTIHYANVATNNCALLYVPAMIGVSARF